VANLRTVSDVLIATDADWIYDEVDAALADDETRVVRVRAGREVSAAVDRVQPSLIVLDLQIGNMGGIAACLDLRLEERAGRLDERSILILLDREADIFLAKRAEADGWLIKPLDAFRLRRAVTTVLEHGEYTEGPEAEAPAV
jgi:DNA-binding response OmpR family regulator